MGIGLDHRGALLEAALSQEQANAVSTALLKQLQAPFLHAALSVQDAIDFADFLTETSRNFLRFVRRTDPVGGEIDIAVVTKQDGFKLIHRKHYVTTTGLSL